MLCPVFGFGPVVQDGFGVGYIIRDNGVQYSISSKHRQTKRYANTLKQTLYDMGKLLGPKHVVKVSRETINQGKTSLDCAPNLPEYLEGFDFFGQQSPSTPNLSESAHKRTSDGSSSFVRVLRRQSSYTAAQLETFGEELPSPTLGNIAEALKSIDMSESEDESK